MLEALISKNQVDSAFEGQELYILLSDRCNFSCSHCLNDSGPNARRWSPTVDSLNELGAEINQNPEIKMLHFSGGEPTLFLPQIKQLLGMMNRPHRIVMTTNGWFVDRTVHYLDDFPIDSIVISYDRFHEPFITLERLIPLIKYLRSIGKDVSVNFVFSDLRELADMAPIQLLGIPVHSARMIKSGRAEEDAGWADSNSIKQTCPSFVPAQRRTPELAKTIYVSQKGFTPCCGPLAFDELAPVSDLYSPTLSQYLELPLRKNLLSGTFEMQAKRLGLDLEPLSFQSSCEACALLYGSLEKGLPSLAKVVNDLPENLYLPLSSDLNSNQETLLLQRYLVAYTEVLAPDTLANLPKPLVQESDTIEIGSLGVADHEGIIAFMKENYYHQYPSHYSTRMVNEFSDFAPVYFGWPSTRGWVYRKNGRIVASIFTNLFDPHSALNEPTLHIGYWGYDRAQVSQDEARFIKAHWLTSLEKWSDGRAVDASFDCFNQSAIRLARSLGFKRRMLRLDLKVE